jgi:hypothetical protein
MSAACRFTKTEYRAREICGDNSVDELIHRLSLLQQATPYHSGCSVVTVGTTVSMRSPCLSLLQQATPYRTTDRGCSVVTVGTSLESRASDLEELERNFLFPGKPFTSH